ncbi:MAG: hypothetical protein WA667_23230 [Candidatus Nitrosopolaris sp.]
MARQREKEHQFQSDTAKIAMPLPFKSSSTSFSSTSLKQCHISEGIKVQVARSRTAVKFAHPFLLSS